MISAMVKLILGIVPGYPLGSGSHRVLQQVAGAGMSHAWPSSEFAESALNEIAIGLIGR